MTTAPGTVTNSVTASADQIDPTQANNTASVTTSVLDLPGSLQFAQPSYSVAEDGGTATIVVTRVGGSQGPVTVDFTVGGGTATAGLDYTPPATTTLIVRRRRDLADHHDPRPRQPVRQPRRDAEPHPDQPHRRGVPGGPDDHDR